MNDLRQTLSKRQRLEQINSQLEAERLTFKNHWRDLNDHILPRRGRFFISDVNKGDRRNQKIIDSTPTLAARTLRSGMMSGLTSPARPWFRLTTQDPDLAEIGTVKQWLHTVTNRMTTVFLKSNLYNVLPIAYGDLGVFGTSAIFMEEDFKDVVRFYSFPIGSYKIATSQKGIVDVFYRDFRMTARQVVQKFGMSDDKTKIDWTNISEQTKSLYLNGNEEAWIDIAHAILPNENYNPNKIESKFKVCLHILRAWILYSGAGNQRFFGGGDDGKILRESGYDYFPVLVPRWEVTGEDIYGTSCPGMEALGDIKQLQVGEKRSAQAIEKMINPPMIAPTSLRNAKASIVPGDITYLDSREGTIGFKPAHEINFRVDLLEQKQEQIRQRISRAFYEDLFLMLAQSDRRQITAREVEERHEEKLLALGPVLEQLNQDLLDPLIDNAFAIMVKQDLIPVPPDELRGTDLKVEYVSIMAQAQKSVGLAGVDRFTQYAAGLMGAKPDIIDKLDMDQLIDVYAEMTSLPPNIVRSDDMVEQIRQQRAQQQQQQQMAQNAALMANTAKDLSQSNLDDNNVLAAITGGR